MRIEIVSDTICPWCFIGKRRLERALAEQPQPDLEIGWRPFQLNPDMPAGGMDRQHYLESKFGGAERARAIYEPIRDAGLSENIDFAFDRIERTPNSVNSHRLIRRAARMDLQNAMVEALFCAYFLEGQDIEAIESLVQIAETAGLDAPDTQAFLESDADVDEVRAEDMMARQMGIQGVPFFILDRKHALAGAQEPAVFHQLFMMAESGETP